MKCTIEEVGPCRKKLNIEFTAEEVGAELDAAIKAFIKGAKIPGFRPGRAPAAMVQRHYSKEIAETKASLAMGHATAAGYPLRAETEPE